MTKHNSIQFSLLVFISHFSIYAHHSFSKLYVCVCMTIEWNWSIRTFITHAQLHFISFMALYKRKNAFHSFHHRLVISIRPQSDFDELWLLIFDNFLSIPVSDVNWKREEKKNPSLTLKLINSYDCFFFSLPFKWSLDVFDEWIKCHALTMTQSVQWISMSYIHSCVVAKLLSVTFWPVNLS